MFKKIILLFFFMIFNTIFSYEVSLPNAWDDIKSESSITIENNFYINTSRKITDYIWYIFWSISFWVLIYAWILLIKSYWQQESLKKANKILIWSIIWIFTSLLAYKIVDLLINLW